VRVVKVYRKGIIALPKAVRETAGVRGGMLLLVEVRDGKIVLSPLDLWERVWESGVGRGTAEEAERELDAEEASWEEVRSGAWAKTGSRSRARG